VKFSWGHTSGSAGFNPRPVRVFHPERKSVDIGSIGEDMSHLCWSLIYLAFFALSARLARSRPFIVMATFLSDVHTPRAIGARPFKHWSALNISSFIMSPLVCTYSSSPLPPPSLIHHFLSHVDKYPNPIHGHIELVMGTGPLRHKASQMNLGEEIGESLAGICTRILLPSSSPIMARLRLHMGYDVKGI